MLCGDRVFALLVAGAALAWQRDDDGAVRSRDCANPRQALRDVSREGSLSFPLETYEQTWLQGKKIRADVLARHMPPWAAVAGYGQFANENRLTLRETQFIVSWVEGLGPRNSGTVFANVVDGGTRPPAVRALAHTGHWMLGEPDLTRPAASEHDRSATAGRRQTHRHRSRPEGRTPRPRSGIHAGRPPRGARGILHRAGNRPVDRELDAVARHDGSFQTGRPIASRPGRTSSPRFTIEVRARPVGGRRDPRSVLREGSQRTSVVSDLLLDAKRARTRGRRAAIASRDAADGRHPCAGALARGSQRPDVDRGGGEETRRKHRHPAVREEPTDGLADAVHLRRPDAPSQRHEAVGRRVLHDTAA